MKLRHLSVLFIAIILYSILIISFHHHAGLNVRPDCAICKFADDLSSGDKAALQSLATLPLVFICFASGASMRIVEAMTTAVITRSPPVYIPS